VNLNASQVDQAKNNRRKRLRHQEYAYDTCGNLIEKRVGLGTANVYVSLRKPACACGNSG
jgi:hypothetical protein